MAERRPVARAGEGTAGEYGLGAVVVSYNTADLLDRCLGSLARELAAAFIDADVWVVDNASRDGSAEMVRRRHPWARLVVLEANRGYAAAANLASFRLSFNVPSMTSDFWTTEFNQMTITKSGFQETSFGFNYELFLTRSVSLVFGLDTFSKSKSGFYKGYVDIPLEDLSGEDEPRDFSLTPRLIEWTEQNFGLEKLHSDYPHWNDAQARSRRPGSWPPRAGHMPC